MRYAAQLDETVARWDRLGWPRPRVMVVSGSGLAVDLGTPAVAAAPLSDWLPFAVHGVPGHPHSLELLLPEPDLPVLYQRGRLHAYQGYSAEQTVFPVRLGALLGARTLLLSNAAGGVRDGLVPGRLVAVSDHLNLTGLNPLRGELPGTWGPRFPDLSQAYDPALRRLAREKAAALGMPLDEGVYAGVAGPSYETPAEIRMLRRLGADLVGMSTVLEVIAARHLGLRCLCLSLVSNLAASEHRQRLDHEDVLAAARAAGADLARLLAALLRDPAIV